MGSEMCIRDSPTYIISLLSLLFDILTTNYHYFCIKSKQPHAACFLSLSTSNPAFPSLHFGSLPAFHPVQCPILLFFLCILDLCLLFLLSNVQSTSPIQKFWTFPNNINAKSPKHHNHMMFWTSALYNLIYMSNQRLPIQHQALARLICLKNKQVPPFKLTTLSTFSLCLCIYSVYLYADMLFPVYNW